jgi:tetratricopeptide (TPR) repeat protein
MEPYFAAHHVNLGVLLWQKQEYARARQELELAVQLQPGQYVPHLNLALFYEGQDQTEGAVTECAAAVALQPQILRSLSSLENDLATGHRTEIVESAKALLRDAMPDDYLPKWASLDFAAGNMDQAKAEWEELLSGNPGDGGTMLSLGRVAAEQGDFESALAWFARAEQNLAPNRLSAVRLNRGAALLNMGDYGAARGELVGGIEAGGSSPVFHYYLGQLAELEADWELALEEHTMATVWEQELETYDTAVRLRPHYVGEFVPGVQVWNTVPERVGPYTGAARAYEMLGRVSEARDIYVNLWNAGTRLEPVREGLQRLAER